MAEEKSKKIVQRRFKGVVVSNKMTKTLVIRVDYFALHPQYGKRYRVSKKYKVHDETGKYKIGDQVEFVECRPISKDKKWRILDIK